MAYDGIQVLCRMRRSYAVDIIVIYKYPNMNFISGCVNESGNMISAAAKPHRLFAFHTVAKFHFILAGD